jgi:hypothetical protein
MLVNRRMDGVLLRLNILYEVAFQLAAGVFLGDRGQEASSPW